MIDPRAARPRIVRANVAPLEPVDRDVDLEVLDPDRPRRRTDREPDPIALDRKLEIEERRHIEDVAKGELRVVIDRTFPLSDAAGAHEYIESRQAFGRVVLVP